MEISGRGITPSRAGEVIKRAEQTLERLSEQAGKLSNTVKGFEKNIKSIGSLIANNEQLSKNQRKTILKQLIAYQSGKLKGRQQRQLKQLGEFGHKVKKNIATLSNSAKKMKRLEAPSTRREKKMKPLKRRQIAAIGAARTTTMESRASRKSRGIAESVNHLQRQVAIIAIAANHQSLLLGETRTERKKLEKMIDTSTKEARKYDDPVKTVMKEEVTKMKSRVKELKKIESQWLKKSQLNQHQREIHRGEKETSWTRTFQELGKLSGETKKQDFFLEKLKFLGNKRGTIREKVHTTAAMILPEKRAKGEQPKTSFDPERILVGVRKFLVTTVTKSDKEIDEETRNNEIIGHLKVAVRMLGSNQFRNFLRTGNPSVKSKVESELTRLLEFVDVDPESKELQKAGDQIELQWMKVRKEVAPPPAS